MLCVERALGVQTDELGNLVALHRVEPDLALHFVDQEHNGSRVHQQLLDLLVLQQKDRLSLGR